MDFRRWLEWIVAYHGTTADHEGFEFDPDARNSLWAGDPGAGLIGPFFSEKKEVADSYPKISTPGKERATLQYELDIRNPRKFTSLKQLHRDMRAFAAQNGIKETFPPLEGARRLAKAYKSHLESLGHDGITFHEGPSYSPRKRELKAAVWVPFNKEQIVRRP